jgi:hypothetical protein
VVRRLSALSLFRDDALALDDEHSDDEAAVAFFCSVGTERTYRTVETLDSVVDNPSPPMR